MEIAERIFQQIQPLIAPLKAEERLTLIRAIAAMEPTASIEAIEATEPTSIEREQRLVKEETAWYRLEPERRARYQGEFVAVHNGEVVDHDPDRRALYLRVREQFGHTPVLIVAGDWTEPPTYTLYSPHLEREL